MTKPAKGTPLTEDEQRLLHLVAQGRKTETIAAQVGVPLRTVEGRIQDMKTKLGARDRANLVHRAHETGLLSSGDGGVFNGLGTVVR